MKCPTCDGLTFTTVSDFRWWCHGCGRVLSGHPAHDDLVPAQAQQFVMLREAIGVCVPSCLRVLLDLLPADADVDRDVTTKVLARVEKAMAAALGVRP